MTAKTAASHDIPQSVRTLRDMTKILRRHRRLSLSVFAATIGLCIALVAVWPRKFSSESKLLVRVGRESVGLDPTATPNQTTVIHEPRETEIQSVLDVMRSQSVRESVVDQLGVSAILQNPTGRKGDRTRALQTLKKAITIDGGARSRVISVKCRTDSPEKSQRWLIAFLNAFQKKHVEANQTSKSYEFFATQIETQRKRLTEASAKLREAKDRIDLVSIEGERRLLENQKGRITTEIVTARADLASTNSAISATNLLIKSLPDRVLTDVVIGIPGDPIGTMRQRLYQLQIRERELLAKFTKHHPDVKSVHEQILQARSIIARNQGPSGQQTKAANPILRQLQVKVLNDQTKVKSLQARLDSLSKQYRGLQKQLRLLNKNEGEIVRLRQNAEVLKKSLVTYTEKFEQARMSKALEADRISNINIFQPPNLSEEASSPNIALFLFVGLFIAVGVGLGSAFVKEYVSLMKIPSLESHPSVIDLERTKRVAGNRGNGVTEATPLVSHTTD